MALEKKAIEGTLEKLQLFPLSIRGSFKISVRATLPSLLQNSGENQWSRND
ncbi:cobalamin biosynthesis protein CbiG [Sesbania bispinosa]|nr:cobalamin biosynthesis protein CbiG [Sesbania bispinosa]